LRACFLPPSVTDLPPDALPSNVASDPAARTLLPLLDWRWPDRLPADFAEDARGSRLTLWRQGRERLALTAAITTTIQQAGVDCLLLKGAALAARYYPDPSLRGIGDIDFQVPRHQVLAATDALIKAGWKPEDGLSPAAIAGQMRARHAWQFYLSRTDVSAAAEDDDTEMCDLHWHPVVRCYSPRLADLFLEGAQIVPAGPHTLRIPCATDLLFHAAAHGLQWSWTPPIRWIPDAWFVISSGAVDWERLHLLAAEADMSFRIHRALEYLKTEFDASVPDSVLESLSPAPAWESREQALLEKPNPLGLADAVRWHVFNFRRLRRFDPAWKESSALSGFLSYLTVFFQTSHRRDLPKTIWQRLRAKEPRPIQPRR
jgi:hypothetical protein